MRTWPGKDEEPTPDPEERGPAPPPVREPPDDREPVEPPGRDPVPVEDPPAGPRRPKKVGR